MNRKKSSVLAAVLAPCFLAAFSLALAGCFKSGSDDSAKPDKLPRKEEAFSGNESAKSSASENGADERAIDQRKQHSGSNLAREVIELRQEVAVLRNQIAQLSALFHATPSKQKTPAPAQSDKLSLQHSRDSSLAASHVHLPNKSGIPRLYPLNAEELVGVPANFPKKGTPLNTTQFGELMTGKFSFMPGSLTQTGRQVTESTPLHVGQEVLLKWQDSWWAATITGFEADGAVRVSYFGWERSWDEAVPRSDIQLDTNVREKAIQTVYPYKP